MSTSTVKPDIIMYVCISERDGPQPFNGEPLRYKWSFIASIRDEDDTLEQPKQWSIGRVPSSDESGQMYECRMLPLDRSPDSDKILTLLQVAKIKDLKRFGDILTDYPGHRRTDWTIEAEIQRQEDEWFDTSMRRLAWENRFGKILESSWDSKRRGSLADLRAEGRGFTSAMIAEGRISDGSRGSTIPVHTLGSISFEGEGVRWLDTEEESDTASSLSDE